MLIRKEFEMVIHPNYDQLFAQCEKKWEINFENTRYNDNYINEFKQNFTNFITKNNFQTEENKKKLLEFLEKFEYLSREKIKYIYLDFFNEKVRKLLEDDIQIIYAPIISSNKVKINSSYYYLNIYSEVTNLSSQATVDFEKAPMHKEFIKNLDSTDDLPAEIHNANLKWLEERLKNINVVIHFDDICGSGDTLLKYLKRYKKVLYKKVLIFHFLIITEYAYNKIETALSEDPELEELNNDQVHLIKGVKNLHKKVEKQFNINDYELEQLKKLEKENVFSDKLKENNNRRKVLGYKDSQCLCAFCGNCPNNTLASFWFQENNDWYPLFPRRDNEVNFFDNIRSPKEIDKENKKINIYLGPLLS